MMPDYLTIPLEVLGYGFAISMGIAALIKGLMVIITKMTKN
jgi:hypothetical protein